MLLPIPVLSVQQGLTQVARSGADVAPRGIDGRWGPNTREALANYVQLDPAGLLSLADQMDLVQRLRSTGTPYAPARAEAIVLPDQIVTELFRQASAFRRSVPAGVDVPEHMQGGADTPRTVIPTNDGQPAVLLPGAQRSGSSPALSIVLGLGAAAVVVGGGYWLMTR